MADRVIPVIAGCTATGKTAAALELASRFSGIEIISADSRQFYRGMDIGTAKPSSSELQSVVHHMIDVADPVKLLSAGWFAKEGMKAIEDVFARGSTPLVVGGSALYLMSLAGLFDDLPDRNDNIREALKSIENEAPGSLHRLLRGIDPGEAMRLDKSDTVRLVRSLEIGLLSMELPSEMKKGGNPDGRFRFAVIEAEGAVLRKRIQQRTSEMLKNGLVDEVRSLLGSGVPEEPVLSATIGYAEIIDYLKGLCTEEEAFQRISVNTWRFARRQRNMFRRLPGAVRTGNSPGSIAEILFKERMNDG